MAYGYFFFNKNGITPSVKNRHLTSSLPLKTHSPGVVEGVNHWIQPGVGVFNNEQDGQKGNIKEGTGRSILSNTVNV